MSAFTWNSYYSNVIEDYQEVKAQYPFSTLTILPTVDPQCAELKVIAANRELIEKSLAKPSDFTGDFSKEIHLSIPTDYRTKGCKVYGAKWLKPEMLKWKDRHIFHTADPSLLGYQLCVGVPESFSQMKNVILENIRTAENILIAYERFMIGDTNQLELIAYSHGSEGSAQFLSNKHRYTSKEQ